VTVIAIWADFLVSTWYCFLLVAFDDMRTYHALHTTSTDQVGDVVLLVS
jgi:hypothetical protein